MKTLIALIVAVLLVAVAQAGTYAAPLPGVPAEIRILNAGLQVNYVSCTFRFQSGESTGQIPGVAMVDPYAVIGIMYEPGEDGDTAPLNGSIVIESSLPVVAYMIVNGQPTLIPDVSAFSPCPSARTVR